MGVNCRKRGVGERQEGDKSDPVFIPFKMNVREKLVHLMQFGRPERPAPPNCKAHVCAGCALAIFCIDSKSAHTHTILNKKGKAMDRFYSFKVVTYNTNESDFQPLLDKAFKWAWILHDKDKTDKHIHILCTFKQNKSFEQVRKMVEGEQNTFARKMEDKYQDFIYLPHSEDFPDKALYNETDIHSNDMSYFQRGCKKSVDNEEFVLDLLDDKLTYRQKAIKYGRDYIRNYKIYENFARRIKQEENLINELEFENSSYNPFQTQTQLQVNVDPETGEITDHKKSP